MVKSIFVNRSALGETELVDLPDAPLAPGEVRLRIQSFSVTANNISYAVIGEAFGYWNFFPAQEGAGIVPMWGHAIVEASRHEQIAPGERVYGYLPMASHLTVRPGEVSQGGFTDMAEHRQPMSPIYNRYSRHAHDPEHDPAREAERMIFGPLFKTGFLLEAMFRREGWFGARQVVVTSASSKTALGFVHCVRASSPDVRVIGLTSAGNVDFVKGAGLYHDVLAYDAVGSLPDGPAVSADFAGNATVLAAIHARYGDDLKHSALIGATHVDARGKGGAGAMAGPKPQLFFAPDHARALLKEMGPKAFGEAIGANWAGFLKRMDGLVDVDRRKGLDAAARAYRDLLTGQTNPSTGIVIEL